MRAESPPLLLLLFMEVFQSTEKRSRAEKERENSCEQPKFFLTYGKSVEKGGTDGKLTQLTTEVNNENLIFKLENTKRKSSFTYYQISNSSSQTKNAFWIASIAE